MIQRSMWSYKAWVPARTLALAETWKPRTRAAQAQPDTSPAQAELGLAL